MRALNERMTNMSAGIFTKMGVLMMMFGVIGGVAAASRTPVHRTLFAASVVVILAGILVRKLHGKELDHGTSMAGSGARSTVSELEVLKRTIEELTGKLGQLEPEHQEEEKQILLNRIETSVLEGIPAVLSSVKKLEEIVGRAHWAVVTSLVSEGERYLNRAWSALSDGYRSEAMDSLTHARARLEEALIMIREG